MKKKIIAIVLLCICASLVLCACSGGGTAGTADSEADETFVTPAKGINEANLVGFDEAVNAVLDAAAEGSTLSYEWSDGWSGENAPDKSALAKGCVAYTLVIEKRDEGHETLRLYFAQQGDGSLSPTAAYVDNDGKESSWGSFGASDLLEYYYRAYYKATGQTDKIKAIANKITEDASDEVKEACLDGFGDPIAVVLDTLTESETEDELSFKWLNKWLNGWQGENAPAKSALDKDSVPYTLVRIKIDDGGEEVIEERLYVSLKKDGVLYVVSGYEDEDGWPVNYDETQAYEEMKKLYTDYYLQHIPF